MTKVEELAGKLSYYIENDDIGSGDTLLKDLLDAAHDDVIAARSEGVAAGAEQEREKIRRMQLCGRRVQVSQFPDDERRNLRIETDVDGVAYTLVPVAVLAPTKEVAG